MKALRAGTRRPARFGESLEPRLVLAGPNDTVGDTLATAAELNPFTYGISFETSDTAVDNPEDVDLFRIDLLAGDQLTLDVESLANGESTPLTALLRLFDEQGAELAANQGTPVTAATLSFEAESAGVFYVGVTGFFHTAYDPTQLGVCAPGTPPGLCTGLSTGPYTLNVFVEAGIDPTSDDTLATANPVSFSFGQETVIADSIDILEDVDMFALVLVEGNEVSATLNPSPGGSNLAGLLRAFDNDGNQVSVTSAAEPTLAFTAVADGVYYIGVSDADNAAYDPRVAASGAGTTTGAYDLRVLVEVGTPFSDADTLDTAVNVDFTPGEAVTFSRKLNTALDVDLIRFELLSGDTLSVDVDAESIGSLLDSLLRVFDAGGNPLTSADDVDGNDPRLSFLAPADGVYYVGISGFCNVAYDPRFAGSGTCDAASTGRYEMSVVVDRPPPPITDGDSTLATATLLPFTSGVTSQLTGAIDPPLDVDLVRLQLAAGDTVSLDVDAQSIGSALDGLLRVFDAAGNPLFVDDNTDGTDPRLSFTATTAGTFFIGLSTACNAGYDPTVVGGGDCAAGAAGNYTLRVLVETPPPPVDDGDNTLATATQVQFSPGVPTALRGAIDPSVDADLYRLVLAAGDRVSLDVDAQSDGSQLNALLRVFDAAGGQLFINDDADGLDPRLAFTADAAGAYFVGVSAACNTAYDPNVADSGQCAAGTIGDYTLNITVVNPPPPPPPPPPVNDGDSTLATANLVAFVPGQPTTFTRAIDPQLDADLYRLDLAIGDVVTIDVAAAAGSSLLSRLRLFSASGAALPIDGISNGEHPTLSFTADRAGTFFVGVSAACNFQYDPRAAGSGVCNAGTTGQYRLDILVDREPGPQRETEPNDTPATADVLELNRLMTGALATAADIDFFSFVVDQPGRLTANVNLAGANVTGRLTLLAADGRTLVTSAGAARIQTHLSPGTYFLSVGANAAVTSYQLNTQFVPATSPRSDPVVGEGPADVALADFNGDGLLDIVAVNQLEFPQDGNLSLLIGLGDGSFQNEIRLKAGDDPTAVATADFDGDGNVDLAVTSLTGVSVLLGRGDGTFETPIEQFAGAAPADLVAGDFNGDAIFDLAVANAGSDDVSVLLGRGDGTFLVQTRLAVGDEPASIIAADFNNDGLLDLAVANRQSDNVSVLLGRTGGGFATATQIAAGDAPTAIAAIDFNGDGLLDLATAAAAGGSVSLLRGTGNGNLATAVDVAIENEAVSTAAGRFRSTLAVSDFNHDGLADLAVSNSFAPTVSVLLSRPSGLPVVIGRAHVGEAPESMAVGDVNGDGRIDLVTGNFDDGALSVRLGRGTGTFQEDLRIVPGNNPRDLAAADIDSDGQLDLVAANFASLAVFRGGGDGGVTDRLRFAADEPSAVTVADFNRDGRPDVAAANFSAGTVQVRLGLGDGSLDLAMVFAVGDQPMDITGGDFNGDGLIDLATANAASGDVSLLLGAGDGTFQNARRIAVGSQPRALAAADLNGDGRLDLAVADGVDDNVTILIGAGDGTFAVANRLTVGDGPRAILAADLTGDGLLDLATADADSDTISLLRANGAGNFAAAVALAVGDEPRSLAAGDFNGDGRLDLASANADSDDISVLLALGGGTFAAESRLAAGDVPGTIVAGDFNADGRLDLAVTSETGDQVSILLGRGDGTFLPPPSFQSHVFQATPLVTDVGADGTPDALLVSQAGRILLRRGRADMPGTYSPPVAINPARPALAVALLPGGATTRLAAIDRAGDTVSIYELAANGSVARQQTLAAGNLPRRIATGDVNGDGLTDVVTLNAGSADVSVFLADATGSFRAAQTVPVGGNPADLLMVDNDGRVDIVVTRQSSGDFILLANSGDGMFVAEGPYRAGSGPYNVVDLAAGATLRSQDGTAAVAFGDFDRDGHADLVTASGGANSLSFLKGVAGGWTNPQALPSGDLPSEIVTADFNRDGRLDMAVLNEGDGDVTVLLGDGRGEFQNIGAFAAGNAATGVTAADTDGDGVLDLLVGNRFGDLMTLMGRGDGTFAPFTRAGRNVALAVADLDGDGRQDWIVANQSLDRVSVQKNDPAGAGEQVFEQQRADGLLAPEAVEIVDLDGDGHADMLVANSGANELLVYLGDGRGQFDAPRRFHAGTNPAGITVSDVNGDGRQDVLIANAGSNDVSVLLGDASTVLKPGVRLDAGQGPVETQVGDFNNDGLTDLLVVNALADNVAMLLGLGGGFFDDRTPMILPTGASPRNLIVGQFDSSPGLDLVTTNFRSNNLTYYSDFASLASSARQDVAVGGIGPVAGAASDFNNDGMLDLVVANNASGSVSLLLGGPGGLALSDVFVDLGVLHPTDLLLAELGQGEGLRLLVTDEGDELVRVFSPEDFLPLETPEPGPLPGGESPGFDPGTLLTFFQTAFAPSLLSGTTLSGVLGGLVTLAPGVISTFDRLLDFDAGDDGSDAAVPAHLVQFIDTVVDVSQGLVNSLLVGVNHTLGTDLTTDDISAAIDELISMYLYGPRWENIASVIRALLDSFSRHGAQAPEATDAVDEVLGDDASDPVVEMILDDVTGAGQPGQASADNPGFGIPVMPAGAEIDLENEAMPRRNDRHERPRLDDKRPAGRVDWKRSIAALAVLGGATIAARRRRPDATDEYETVRVGRDRKTNRKTPRRAV